MFRPRTFLHRTLYKTFHMEHIPSPSLFVTFGMSANESINSFDSQIDKTIRHIIKTVRHSKSINVRKQQGSTSESIFYTIEVLGDICLTKVWKLELFLSTFSRIHSYLHVKRIFPQIQPTWTSSSDASLSESTRAFDLGLLDIISTMYTNTLTSFKLEVCTCSSCQPNIEQFSRRQPRRLVPSLRAPGSEMPQGTQLK